MKKLSLLLLFITTAIFSYGQTTKGPIIKFENLVHDYGTIYQGGDGNCTFTFKNIGDEPLVLSNVSSSCGCTVPKWPNQPILPGQSEVIRVTYDTKRLGPISKQITVISNAKEAAVTLTIKGNILQKPNEVLPEKQTNQGFTPSAH